MENKEITPRQMFVNEVENMINKLVEIDKSTPWQPVEPEWWLEMSDLERNMRVLLEKLKNK